MGIQQTHMEILEAQELQVIVSPMAIAQHQVGLLTKQVDNTLERGCYFIAGPNNYVRI